MSIKCPRYPVLAVAAATVVLCACRSQQSESTPQLINELQTSAPLRKRAGAARILGARKAVQAVPPLITALREPYPVRVSAARALGTIRDPRAVEPLIQLLTDFDTLVREAAARALALAQGDVPLGGEGLGAGQPDEEHHDPHVDEVAPVAAAVARRADAVACRA